MTRSRTGSEKEVLLAFLDQQRDAAIWKLEGLRDDQLLERPIAPDGLHLLGLLKHLAATEAYWLGALFGRATEPISVAASDHAELDAGDTTWLGDTVSLRWAILHTIEESARHLGHADVIRQLLDGATGHLPEHLLPY